ncbi:hypothetical protein [Microseira wollei]|uniref:Uncharacterized protein n=1 Tax=Microseira wollei NIES-4236 TaxID=2530354 RepID=A0AAV3WF86_9CYAN|nr:hypothetical protein [Microseira wollei]GET36339.1 hypothetical protein MiSe_10870 [Microseira wollei NIES-4236]
MGMRLSCLKGVMIVVAAAGGFANSAIADPYIFVPDNDRAVRIDQQFNRVFFSNDREFFKNRSIERQLDFLFGLRNSYPENEINRDGRGVHNLYVEVLERQVGSDPILLTPDLPNPFNTSLRQLPPSSFSRPFGGRELINEELPPR